MTIISKTGNCLKCDRLWVSLIGCEFYLDNHVHITMTTAGTVVSTGDSLTLIKMLFSLLLAKGLTIAYRGTNNMSAGYFLKKKKFLCYVCLQPFQMMGLST